MPSTILVITPPHFCNPQLAIAAVRGGASGLVDLGYEQEWSTRREAIARLAGFVGASDAWGIRWDTLARADRSPGCLAGLWDAKVPTLLLAGLDRRRDELGEILRQSRGLAERVWIEAYSVHDALSAEEAGFDGVVLVGYEAGGRISRQSSFILLQQLRHKLAIPYWIRGGIGVETGAAAVFAGATGVVLGEQLWLTDESHLSEDEKRFWRQLDGSEAAAIGDDQGMFRVLVRGDRTALLTWERELASGGDWVRSLTDRLLDQAVGEAQRPLLVGQEIAFAAELADRYGSVSSVLRALKRAVRGHRQSAIRDPVLAPGASLARHLGVQYPILQGPMTRVSDVPGFCEKVGDHGALPFLALALMRQPNLGRLLESTAEVMGDRPWGVGLLGFVPPELRMEQMHAVRQARPKYAIIAGGRPSQAKELEELGTACYLHVPSPRLVADFVRSGWRRFIFEGAESGGHIGPRTSFILWQSMVDVLSGAAVADPESLEVIFAGGIHDALSAAMVSVIAAPLAARGAKVGVLMGTAYLFTPEAVEGGAITAEFQRQALACDETALLVSGLGHVTRAARTPYVSEFDARKKALLLAGKSSDEIKYELEVFNIGRLRVASKGLTRKSAGEHHAQSALAPASEDEQRRTGLYMIGEVATLHDQVRSMSELHQQVCEGSQQMLNEVPQILAAAEPQLHRRPGERLAIVGMGCMFPESPELRSYWHNILRGFSALVEVPADRWRPEDYFDPDRLKPDQVCSKRGSFIDPIRFDPFRYRIPPASMPSIEPIQLMALEASRQALEDAGYGRRYFPQERTSVVFAAAGTHDLGLKYAFRVALRHWLPRVDGLDGATRSKILADLEAQLPKWTEDSFAGFLMNVVAGRIANRFNLQGSNFTVDAACASSLAALQVAAEQLRSGACDAALVGAADGTNNPFCFMSFAKTFALSPKRSCPFDEESDGINLGEGIAALVLKRLGDAERDGDQIYAVVAGIGSSSDGPARSMTAPNPEGQKLALARAYEDAAVSMATVGLIEAHSTGTPVGDQVETTALSQMFSAAGAAPKSCAVGSVKSMIGHTKGAAGFASLIKTALALKHKILPPTVGVRRPNAILRSKDCPFYVSSEVCPWFQREPEPRRAGVSAFGFGGTNFHVVLEEYRGDFCERRHDSLAPRAAEVFAWTRSTRQEILRAVTKLEKGLSMAPVEDLAQLAYSVLVDNLARHAADSADPKCRLAIVASSVDELQERLLVALRDLPDKDAIDNPAGLFYSEAEPMAGRALCFLFPGQGSQAIHMLKDLVLYSPWSWHLFEQADRELAGFFDQPLTRFLYPLPVFSEEERSQQQAMLNDTRRAQPSLGLVELFALGLLGRFGIEPGMVAGHSYGEYVALCAAGALSPGDVLKLSAVRGQAVYEAGKSNPGAMASVFAGAEETAAAISDLKLDVLPANFNDPHQTVIAGPIPAIDTAVEKLSDKGLRAKKIPVTAAFHTPAMRAAREVLETHLSEIRFEPPRIPVFSNVTGSAYPAEPETMRRQLGEQITSPVQFVQQIQEMYSAGARVFLEVGPGSVLTGLVRRNLAERPHTAVSLDAKGLDGWMQLAHVLARLAVLGLEVHWKPWFEDRRLSYWTTAEYFRKVRADSACKPTDWVVGPGGARPATSSRVVEPRRDGARPETAGEGTAAGRQETAGARVPVQEKASEPGPVVAGLAAAGPVSQTGQAEPSVHERPSSTSTPIIPHTLELTAVEREHQADPTERVETPATSHATNGALSVELLSQFQYAMSQWLELQREQQQTNQHFLDTQQTVMLALLGEASRATTVQRAPRALKAPVPVLGPRPLPARVSPAPVAHGHPPARPVSASVAERDLAARELRAVSPAVEAAAPLVEPGAAPAVKSAEARPLAAAAPTTSEPARAARSAVSGDGKSAVLPTPAATTGGNGAQARVAPTETGGAPSVEVFRSDLLQAISERTGYPLEMLDEKLELEAGLGIDSIKTIEIFGSLTQYHAFLPGAGEDQEESLAAFARLRTIGDILAAYEANRNSRQANSGANTAPLGRAALGQAALAGGDDVDRVTLQAVEAGLPADGGEKKNSPHVTLS